MSEMKKTSRLVLNYSWGFIATSVASVISFPVFTRVFSVSDYGVLSLVFSTLTILFVFSKLGMQNSIIRFYPEYELSGGEQKSVFFSTYLFSIISIGISVTIIFVLIIPYFSKNVLSLRDSLPFYAAALFIPSNSLMTIAVNFFRARQEPVLFNILSISDTYIPLLLGLAFLVIFGANVANFFLGGFVGKILYTVFLSSKIKGDCRISVKLFSGNLLSRAFWFGFPLFLLEISAVLLAYGDRFIIKYFLTTTDVAIYSVGYNLSIYMTNLFVAPINAAVQAEYFSIWTKQGREATERYLSQTCKAIMYFGTIFCVVMILNFKYVIILFASAKYIESIAIAPYVITSLMIYSLYPVFGAGIFVSKSTKYLFYTVFAALVFNIFANVILIPRIGIIGAAVATFAANSLAAVSIFSIAARVVKIRIRLFDAGFCLMAGVVSFLVCNQIEFNLMILNIVLKTIFAIIMYFLSIILFDHEYKDYIKKMLSILKSRVYGT